MRRDCVSCPVVISIEIYYILVTKLKIVILENMLYLICISSKQLYSRMKITSYVYYKTIVSMVGFSFDVLK